MQPTITDEALWLGMAQDEAPDTFSSASFMTARPTFKKTDNFPPPVSSSPPNNNYNVRKEKVQNFLNKMSHNKLGSKHQQQQHPPEKEKKNKKEGKKEKKERKEKEKAGQSALAKKDVLKGTKVLPPTPGSFNALDVADSCRRHINNNNPRQLPRSSPRQYQRFGEQQQIEQSNGIGPNLTLLKKQGGFPGSSGCQTAEEGASVCFESAPHSLPVFASSFPEVRTRLSRSRSHERFEGVGGEGGGAGGSNTIARPLPQPPPRKASVHSSLRGKVKIERQPSLTRTPAASDKKIGQLWKDLTATPDAVHTLGAGYCFQMLNNVLKVMGLGDSEVREVEDMVMRYTIVTRRRKTEHGHLVPPSLESCLRGITKNVNECLELQATIDKVVKAQAFVRGYLARKRFKHLYVTFINTPLQKRNECFREILKRERTYLKHLKALVYGYMMPLREQSKGVRALCSEKDITSIFGNLEALLTVHLEVYRQLMRVQEKWPEVDYVGEVFLTMAPFFKAYGEYINNFQTGIATLLEFQQNKRFTSLVNEIYDRLKAKQIYVDLHSLLTTPLNHISGYEGQILNLLNNTPESHKDYSSLFHCHTIISSTAEYIRESLATHNNQMQLQAIQDKLVKDAFPGLVQDPKRVFVREGSCLLAINKNKKKKAHLFACNDVLLIAAPSKTGFKLKERIIWLKGARVANIEEPLFEGSMRLYALAIGGERSNFTLMFTERADKQLWFEELKRLIGLYQKNRVFGVPLKQLLENDPKAGRHVPHILERLVEHLETRKITELEGIFRVSGNIASIAFLKDSFDKAGVGMNPDVNLGLHSPHDISGLLKMFFREMPEPLLTFTLYEPIVKLASKHAEAKNNSNKTEGEERRKEKETFLQEINELLAMLPPEHKEVLKYLLGFLHRMAQSSSVSKMNTDNLSIVFSPNVCRPARETIEYSLELSKVNRTFGFMIDHHDQLNL
ncbi:Rho-type gtpase-activating protein [Balamuthia mandrillaris]